MPEAGALGPHHLGLEHIVAGVAEHHHPGAGRSRRIRDQGVARPAGGRRNASGGFVASPGEADERDTEPSRGLLRQPRPRAAGGLKTMVDVQGEDLAAGAVSPLCGRDQGRQGVATAGIGHGDRALRAGVEATVEDGDYLV